MFRTDNWYQLYHTFLFRDFLFGLLLHFSPWHSGTLRNSAAPAPAPAAAPAPAPAAPAAALAPIGGACRALCAAKEALKKRRVALSLEEQHVACVMRPAARLFRPILRAATIVSGARYQCSADRKTFATPWPLPESSISPKLFNDSARNGVRSALAAFDVTKPVAAAATPPASWYLEPSFAQAELLGVFSKTWQLVCRADQVSLPGSFATSFIGSDPVNAPPTTHCPHCTP